MACLPAFSDIWKIWRNNRSNCRKCSLNWSGKWNGLIWDCQLTISFSSPWFHQNCKKHNLDLTSVDYWIYFLSWTCLAEWQLPCRYASHTSSSYPHFKMVLRKLGPSQSPVVSDTVTRFKKQKRARSALRWGAVTSVAMVLVLADLYV